MVALAAPASAHTVGGGGPTNYTTRLGALTPATPGLTLKVIENGSRLELRNGTGQQVIVKDYDGYPYLRIDGTGGVYENLLSQATYLNTTRNGLTNAIPQLSGMDTGAVGWKKVSGGTLARWHDHRIHFVAGAAKPPLVRADPGHQHDVGDYTIELTVAGAAVVAKGQLLWVPGPSSLPWLLVALVFLVAVGFTARLRGWRIACAVALLVVVASDVIHSTGIALDKAGTAGQRWSAFFVGSWVDVIAWIAGIAAAVLLTRRRVVAGFYLAAGAGALIGIIGGLADFATLDSSTAPFAWSIHLARAVTAVSIGGGFGLLAMTVLGLNLHDRPAAGSGQSSAASAAAIQASSSDSRSDSS